MYEKLSVPENLRSTYEAATKRAEKIFNLHMSVFDFMENKLGCQPDALLEKEVKECNY
jgi:hypothetical protein